VIGLQSISQKDVPWVLEKIEETLRNVVAEGIPKERVESLLHQTEIAIKHVTGSFGINLFSSITGGWLHGASLPQLLTWSPMIERLRSEVEKGGFFESLIEKYLINNTVTILDLFLSFSLSLFLSFSLSLFLSFSLSLFLS